VDEKQAALMNIRLDVNDLMFEYREQQGEVHREVYSTTAFYKLQEHYYSEREFKPQDPWQRTRARE
jgi:hypothetical protein